MKRSLFAVAVLVSMVSAVQAGQFYGTVTFDDGTVGPLTKALAIQSAATPQSVDTFGGPGKSWNLRGGEAGSIFMSSFYCVDTSAGAGDVYGDVTVKALYMPSANWESPIALRVQQVGSDGTGYGLWASKGTNGWGQVSIGYQGVGGGMSILNRNPLWNDGSTITISDTAWYDVTMSAIGQTISATITELNASFLPVAGHTATVSYTDASIPLTGMVGTRSAQSAGNPGYLIDNFQVTPEPITLALLALGGLAAARRRV